VHRASMVNCQSSASRSLIPPLVLMASICFVSARDAKAGEHRHALGTTYRFWVPHTAKVAGPSAR
jgi:hypothetical protein